MNYLYKLVTTENVEINYDTFKKKELIECLVTMRDIYFSLKQENKQLKDNWNKLNEFLKSTRKENLEWDKKHNCEWQGYNAYSELLIKIQELEQGSDSNE
jgi:hypothetical protein